MLLRNRRWLICLSLALAGCASGNTTADDLGGGAEAAPDGPATADRGAADLLSLEAAASDLPPVAADSTPPDSGPPADSQAAPDSQPGTDSQPAPDSQPGTDSAPGVEVCNNAADDDGDGQTDCADLVDCGSVAPCMSASRTLVIHEVFPGTPDYVVVRNASNVPRNISGYVLEMEGTGPVTFTLPSKTLGPGQIVAVFEYADGTGADDINTGNNIPFYNGLTGSYANAVTLRAPGGSVVDYVGFGGSLAGLPGGASQVGGPVSYTNFDATTEAHFRAGMQGAWPTFYASDWVAAAKSR